MKDQSEKSDESERRQAEIQSGALAGVAIVLLVTILPQHPLSDFLQRAVQLLAFAIPVLACAVVTAISDAAVETIGKTAHYYVMIVFEAIGGLLVIAALTLTLWQANELAGKLFLSSIGFCLFLIIVVGVYHTFAVERRKALGQSETSTLAENE